MTTNAIAMDEEPLSVGTEKVTKTRPKAAAEVAAVGDTAPVVDHRFETMSEKTAPLVKALVLPALTFAIIVAIWAYINLHVEPAFPSPAQTWDKATQIFAEPFYDNGPNDKGIGWQVLYSLGRVMAGFALAVVVGIPVGFMIGRSEMLSRAWSPLIQILKPVSPLAWLPIGLLLFRAVDPSAIFVIFITSIWPIIINTAAGVKAVPQDYLNVASVLRLGRWEFARRILVPATLPSIVTGMRLSISVAWMVIVAAEMLTGGVGIGFYIWDEWNNLSVSSIIVCIVVIGFVGMALEAMMNAVHRRFDYTVR